MAHQDDAGPPVREKLRSSWRLDAAAHPPGSAAPVRCPGGKSRAARPTAGSRPSWSLTATSLSREAAYGLCALEATPGSHVESGNAPAVVFGSSGTVLRDCALGSIRKRVVLSLGKGRAGFALGVTLETLRRVHESRLSWRWTHCLVLFREGTVVLPTDRRSLRNGHAECESHACCGVRRRAAPPSGGSVADSLLLGATPVRPQRVRESPLSWRLHACRSPSGDCETDAEPWSLLQGSHRLRESKICACRGLDVLRLLREMQHDSEHWNHSPALPRSVRKSAVRNTNVRAGPLSGGAVQRTGLPSGGAVQTLRMTPRCRPDLFREVRATLRPTPADTTDFYGSLVQGCVGQCAGHASFGKGARPVTLPSGSVPQPLCSDGNQPRRKRNGTLRGCLHAIAVTVRWTTCKGPGPHEVSSTDWTLSARKGGRPPKCGIVCGYAADSPSRSPVRPLLLSTECSQAAVDCNRPAAWSGHTQPDGMHCSQERSAAGGCSNAL